MMWRISLIELGLALMLLTLSSILIIRRRREARESVPVLPASQGGSPLWLWVVLALWAGFSLLFAAALILTGNAVIDY